MTTRSRIDKNKKPSTSRIRSSQLHLQPKRSRAQNSKPRTVRSSRIPPLLLRMLRHSGPTWTMNNYRAALENQTRYIRFPSRPNELANSNISNENVKRLLAFNNIVEPMLQEYQNYLINTKKRPSFGENIYPLMQRVLNYKQKQKEKKKYEETLEKIREHRAMNLALREKAKKMGMSSQNVQSLVNAFSSRLENNNERTSGGRSSRPGQ